jgi:hypothetical protein
VTKTAILAAVQTNHNRTDRDTIAETGLNLALQEMVKDFDWKRLKTTLDVSVESGDTYVQMISGFLKVTEIRFINDTQSYPIEFKNREQVLRDFPNVDADDAGGYPMFAYIEGDQLFIVPKINTTGTIRVVYYATPTFPTTEDEISPFIPSLDQFLISYATSWVFMSLQMFREASTWMSIALASLEGAKALDMREGAENRIRQGFQSVAQTVLNPEDPFNGILYGNVNGGPYGGSN